MSYTGRDWFIGASGLMGGCERHRTEAS
jgi:hypothetical protein